MLRGLARTCALSMILDNQLIFVEQMQQDSMVGLKKDLSGAQARISDMTGELSESQKQELEHNR